MDNNKDQKFHEYDGIIELDNPMPTWWVWTFALTIIFSGLYFIHYVVAGGPTLKDELKVALAEVEKVRSHSQASNLLETEDSLKSAFTNDLLGVGESQYTAKCAVCHGAQLQGMIGPNLTDHFWLHGTGARTDIVKLIRQGVPEKGMPPWESALKKDEVYALAAYIISKRGSKPAQSKEPQGAPSEKYLNADW